MYYPSLKEWIDKDRNILFKVPMRKVQVLGPIAFTTSDDPEHLVTCTLDFSRYDYNDDREPDYKVEAVPLEKGFSRESFYCSDFMSLVKSEVIVPVLIPSE